MKKILVIGTGGTIASVETEEGLRPAYDINELISFFPEAKEIASLDGKTLFNLDSTNMQPRHWSEIAEEIGRQYEKYDGFVITHGTDTMQYTAAALSFMLKNLGKPVVLTGSIKAIGKGSDAKQNFVDSVIVASSGIGEVCVVFHDKIIKGCKAKKIINEATKINNYGLAAYSSINSHHIGEMVGTFEENGRNIKRADKKEAESKKPLEILPNAVSEKIILVKIYPGFNPEIFDKLRKFNAIVIEGFGPGNIPYFENSLVDKIEMLSKENVPVFIATQNPFGEADLTIYEVGQKAMKAGAISCKDMTSETALVKLMWIMGNFGKNPKTVKELMQKNFVGEIRE